MYEPEIIQRARELYLKLRSVDRVWKEMKKEGYIVSRSSIKRWKKEGNWDDIAEKYDRSLAELDIYAKEFEDKLLLDLMLLSKKYREKIMRNPEKIIAQDLYGLIKINEQILDIKKGRNGNIIGEDTLSEVLDVLLEDKVIGPILISRKDEIFSKIQKLLKKKGKNATS